MYTIQTKSVRHHLTCVRLAVSLKRLNLIEIAGLRRVDKQQRAIRRR